MTRQLTCLEMGTRDKSGHLLGDGDNFRVRIYVCFLTYIWDHFWTTSWDSWCPLWCEEAGQMAEGHYPLYGRAGAEML